MSKFLEIPNCAMTPWCLQQEALHYILRECRQSIDTIDYSGGHPEGNTKGQEKKLIQLLIDKSNGNLRMYGTAEELLENLNIFKNFPANLTFFDNSMECYQTRQRIFKSFNNEEYIAKSDLFVILQNMIIELGPVKIIHVALFLAFYLKTHEKKVENSMEFVKFDKNFFDEIEKEFKEKVSTDDALAARVLHGFVEFANLSQAQIVEKFQELIPSALSRRTHFFINRLTNFFNSAAEGLRFGMPGVWAILSLQIKALKSVIDRNPNMFLPRHKNSKEPITLRVFEDEDQQFLMKSEVSDALKATSTSRKILDDEDDHTTMNTMSLEEVLKNFDTKNVEFIRYPILRAKHRATPIPISTSDKPNGTCILAIDAFFQFFKELTLGLKFYQKGGSVDDVNRMISALKKTFKLNYTTPYFVPTPDEGIVKRVANFVNKDFGNVPAKELRDVKKEGFTVRILKNELADLGLTTKFPEIQNYAEAVYFDVMERKKERYLRTCDLFDAVEHCQLNCTLERLPILKKFVHNQKGCHRVYGLECEYCDGGENPETQKLLVLKKELAELQKAHDKICKEYRQKSREIQELEKENEPVVKRMKLDDSYELSIDDEERNAPSTSNLS